MKYKIYCEQRNQYFANNATFESLKECRDQLISYHNVDCECEDLNSKNLYEIVDGFEWEIHDTEGNKINYKLLQTIK